MSMLSNLVQRLRDEALYFSINPDFSRTTKVLKEAADAIEDQGAKLHSANMELSRRIYESAPEIKWHPYPEEKPEVFDGCYLVTIQDEDWPPGVGIETWENGLRWDCMGDLITAWAELPEPYKEEENA